MHGESASREIPAATRRAHLLRITDKRRPLCIDPLTHTLSVRVRRSASARVKAARPCVVHVPWVVTKKNNATFHRLFAEYTEPLGPGNASRRTPAHLARLAGRLAQQSQGEVRKGVQRTVPPMSSEMEGQRHRNGMLLLERPCHSDQCGWHAAQFTPSSF